MQSKYQVFILGITIFEEPEQTVRSNHSADRVRKKNLLLPPGLRTTFTMLWTCPVQKWSLFGSGKYLFHKSEKMSDQTVQPIKIKTIALFYLSWPPSLLIMVIHDTMTEQPKNWLDTSGGRNRYSNEVNVHNHSHGHSKPWR